MISCMTGYKAVWVDCEVDLPPNDEWVLGYYCVGNHGAAVDKPPLVNRVNFKVVKFIRGRTRQDVEKGTLEHDLSTGEAYVLEPGTEREQDEVGNNFKPYGWSTFGRAYYCGQEISHWTALPSNKP
jgi:hypothetical protein